MQWEKKPGWPGFFFSSCEWLCGHISLIWATFDFLCLCFFKNIHKCPENVYLNMSNITDFVKEKQDQINLRINGANKAKWYFLEPNVYRQSWRGSTKWSASFTGLSFFSWTIGDWLLAYLTLGSQMWRFDAEVFKCSQHMKPIKSL